MDYRHRIYQHYVQNREQELAPKTVAGLAPRAPYLKKLILTHFPPDRASSILDLGCGHGALLYFARQLGYQNLHGVDGSPQQVEAAKQLGISTVEQGDLLDTLAKQADASVDVVVAFDVLEHFTKDELIFFVDEVCRVLRPDGRWIVHVPNAESPFFGRVRYGDFTHELAFTCTSLHQLMLSSGFSQVECFEDTPIVHGFKSAIRFVLWQFFRQILKIFIAAETGNFKKNGMFSQNILAVVRK